jgi:hypothetical protein
MPRRHFSRLDEFGREPKPCLADELRDYWHPQQCIDRTACVLDMHVSSGAYRKLIERVAELEQKLAAVERQSVGDW